MVEFSLRPAPEARNELAQAVRPGTSIYCAEPRRGDTVPGDHLRDSSLLTLLRVGERQHNGRGAGDEGCHLGRSGERLVDCLVRGFVAAVDESRTQSRAREPVGPAL